MHWRDVLAEVLTLVTSGVIVLVLYWLGGAWGLGIGFAAICALLIWRYRRYGY